MQNQEIERKFLVRDTLQNICQQTAIEKNYFAPLRIEQSYLGDTGLWAIRVRRSSTTPSHAQWRHEMTLKQRVTEVTNTEIEFSIFPDTYDAMVEQSFHRPLIKDRWQNGNRFTIDQFLNPEFNGLLLAEIELKSEDERFFRPDWLGEEVTGQKEYANYYMAQQLKK